MALNEAAVQFMASLASGSKSDTVRYYGMDFSTESTDYYPLQTALIKEITYFTGTYPLFHSTLFSNDVFKNTFISRSSLKTYLEIEKNFDLLVNYETSLANISYKISVCSDSKSSEKKLKSLLKKSNCLKSDIQKITLETQNIILHDCFIQEFENIRDIQGLKIFKSRIYNFKNLLINSEDYNYYNEFYIDMMNLFEEKREQIKKYGALPYNDVDSQELALVDTKLPFFKKIFEKLSLIIEEKIRTKEM
jgi:hypothetical protein